MSEDLQKYKQLFDTMELGIVYQDSEGKIIEVNPAALRILGLSKNEILNLDSFSNKWKAIKEDGSPFSGKDHPAMVALRTGKKVNNTIMGIYSPKDKKYKWINISATPEFKNNKNKPFRVYSVFNDYSEFKTNKDHLFYFKKTVEFSANAVGIATPEGKHWYQNKAFSELFGEAGEDPPSSIYVNEKDGREVFDVIMNGKTWAGEVKMYDKDKKIRNIDLRAYPIKNNQEEIIGLVGVHIDISENKKLLEKLSDSEYKLKQTVQQFEAVINAMPGIISVVDTEFNVIMANNEVVRVFGQSNLEQVLNKKCYNVRKGLKNICPQCGIKKAFDTGETVMRISTPEEEKLMGIVTKAYAVPLKNNSGNSWGGIEIIMDITDLRENEKKYRLLLNSLNDAVFLHPFKNNKFGKFIEVNDSACKRYEYSRDEFLNLSPIDLISKNTPQQTTNSFLKKISEKDTLIFETIHCTKSGREFPVEINSSLVEINQTKYILAVVRDISERKKIEAVLKENEKNLIKAQQIAKAGHYIYDIISDEWINSKELNNIFEIDENYNRHAEGWLKIIHPDHQHMMGDYLRKDVIGKKHPFNKEYKIIANKSKTEKWVHGLGELTVDDKGKVIQMLGTIQDITERKRTEEALKESEEKFRQLAEQSPNMIFINLNGKVIYANKACEKFTKYSIEEFYNDEFNFLTLIDPESIGGILENFKKHNNGQDVPPFEYRLVTKDGDKLDVVINTKLIFYQKQGAILGIVTDISQQKNTEKELQKQMDKYYALNKVYLAQNEELIRSLNRIQNINKELIIAKEKAQESDRLKTTFLANMSHEIRTPMNGILGFAELLKNPELTGEKQKKYVEVIQQSGQRMLNIINDLIDISKIEAGQIEIKNERTDINQLIDNLYIFFKPEADKKGLVYSCNKALSDRNCSITADRTKLTQILSNLIKNAFKYTLKGNISFGYKLVDNYIEFYIEDTGIGIGTEYIDKIFERFRQIDLTPVKAEEGSGLGLSISKAYVEMMGGKIWVKSKLNKGSAFYFTIPYVISITEDLPVNKIQGSASDVSKIQQNSTILIVEDDETSYLYLVEVLKQFNVNILQTDNGKTAFEMVRSKQPIDLILMDIKLPEIDGLKTTEKIRKINPTVPIIAQTAFASETDRLNAIKAGCNDYISKPIDNKLFISIISNYLKK